MAQKNIPHPPTFQRLKRILHYSVITLSFLIVSTIMVLTWITTTHSGLKFAVHQLPKLAGIHIQTNSINGTILKGFKLNNLMIDSNSTHIKISDINFQWQPEKLWQAQLHINEFTIGHVDIINQSTSTPKSSSQPLTFPKSIDLPITVNIDSIKLGQLNQTNNKNQKLDIIRNVNITYHYNHQEHKLNIQSLHNEWSNSQGAIVIETDSPFSVRGFIISHGKLDDIEINNNLVLSGSLENINIYNTLIGNGVELYLDSNFHPFAHLLNEKLGNITLRGNGINPNDFLPTLPQADLTFALSVHPEKKPQNTVIGALSLENHKTGYADKNHIPIKKLAGNIHISEEGLLTINQLATSFLKEGLIDLTGTINTTNQHINLNIGLDKITAQDLVSTKLTGTLTGQIQATDSFTNPNINWTLNTGNANIAGHLTIQSNNKGQQLLLEQANIQPNNGGNLHLSGSYELFSEQKLAINILSEHFNPKQLYPSFPDGNINGEIKINGLVSTQQFDIETTFAPSQLSGETLSGNSKLVYHDQHLVQADTHINLGRNQIQTNGAFGKKGDILNLNINAPELNHFGFGIQGKLNAQGNIQTLADDFKKLDISLKGQAQQLSVGKLLSIQELDFSILASPEITRPLNININGKNIHTNGLDINYINTSLTGTLQQHTFHTQSDLKLDNNPLNLNINANGGLNNQQQWNGSINVMDIAGALNLKLTKPFTLKASTENIELNQAYWQALKGTLNIDKLSWHAQNGISSKGNANNLHLEELHHFYQPPIQHDLVLAGDWDFVYNQSPQGYLNIQQQNGDIIIPTKRKQALGLKNFTLKSKLGKQSITNEIQSETQYGNIHAKLNVFTNHNSPLTNAPIDGNIIIQSNHLDTLNHLMPIGQSISGTVQANIHLTGELSNPLLSGSITGEKLNYRNRDIGIFLNNGILKSRLDKQKLIIDELNFQRKNGRIHLQGAASYNNNLPQITAQVDFEQYQILDHPTRRLTISGNSQLKYDTTGLDLKGYFKTDEGRFGFQDSSAPTLDDDVIIIGENKEKTSSYLPINMNITFNLNDQIHFSGQGLNVTLGGELQLKTHIGNAIDAVGSINIVQGSYKAYGQDLVISKGVISFVGPLNDPNLNIRAERRNSSVGAGVEVLGSLNIPRITLVANEPMSEKDKLSWLILNRASSGSSTDEAALSTAAAAFLAGSINDRVGLLDNFGLTSQQTRNAQTGEMNPAQQVLTFGKQLTQNIYLGYEAGLQTASQSAKLVYNLSHSWQLIIRAGTESSGGEIKYLKRFD